MTPTYQEIEALIERMLNSCEDGIPPDDVYQAATALRALLDENARYKSHLWWLVGGGEFSHWFISSSPSLPLAALKEWQEARQCFPELVENEPAPQESKSSIEPSAKADSGSPAGVAPIEPVAWRFNNGKMYHYVNHSTDLSCAGIFESLYSHDTVQKLVAERDEYRADWMASCNDAAVLLGKLAAVTAERNKWREEAEAATKRADAEMISKNDAQQERDELKADAEKTEEKVWLNFYALMEKSLIFGFDTPAWMKEECRQRLEAAMKGEK